MANYAIDTTTGVLGMYRETSTQILQMLWPGTPRRVIHRVVDKAIRQQYKEIPVKLVNNYEKKEKNSNILALIDYIQEQKPISTAYGVLFQRHTNSINPLTDTIKMFMDNRGINKNKMFEYPEGSEMFERYNLFQLLDKLDCNAIYGILSAASSSLYNIYVAGSITGTGRALISSATMFFESFLANNVKFASLDEVLIFINNVRNERSRRVYDDSIILNRNMNAEEVFAKLVLSIGDYRDGRIRWYPSEEDLDVIWIAVSHLDQQDLNRLYYKNNLYSFFENKTVHDSLLHILDKMDSPFLNPNKVPADIKPELEALYEIVKEYVFYNYQIIDAIERNKCMVKKAALISDTDSSIVSFDPWYNFVLQKLQRRGTTLKIGDPAGKDVVKPYKDYRYSFITQEYEIVDTEKTVHEEDMNIRFSILNIIAFFCSGLINEYMISFTKKHNSWDESKPCLIIMKNEFTFGTALLTDQKKHYASIQQLKEGHMLNGGIGKLDIKGLEMNKSGVNDAVKEELKDILLNDVLLAPEIDQTRIITRLAILEKKIEENLRSGSKRYFKPVSIKSHTSYDDPFRIQGIKASWVWNQLCGDELPHVDLNDRNTVDVIKVDIRPDNIDKVKDKYPDLYERLVAMFNVSEVFPNGKGEVTALAIHQDVKEVPAWVFEFINYQEIIRENVNKFPKASLGIQDLGNDKATTTNLIAI